MKKLVGDRVKKKRHCLRLVTHAQLCVIMCEGSSIGFQNTSCGGIHAIA
jgi:hypothetical protein